MSFIVMCRVSGGVTGTREARLKDNDGQVRYFETKDEAQAVATEIEKQFNGNPFRKAEFRYWVEEA